MTRSGFERCLIGLHRFCFCVGLVNEVINGVWLVRVGERGMVFVRIFIDEKIDTLYFYIIMVCEKVFFFYSLKITISENCQIKYYKIIYNKFAYNFRCINENRIMLYRGYFIS